MASYRPPAHRIHFSDLAGIQPGSVLRVEGPEGHHAAKVKRLRAGEPVELFDGRGLIARAVTRGIEMGKRAAVDLEVGEPSRAEPVSPHVEVWCPPPKGDRLETMIDQLSQLGVAVWRPLRAARSERDAYRPDKLERVAIESAKQCGRAWLIRLGDWIDLDDALSDPRSVLADASGTPAEPAASAAMLLLGPEGGWTPDEIDHARATGRSVVRFGPHVMRIETAAVAGASCLLCQSFTPTPVPGGNP